MKSVSTILVLMILLIVTLPGYGQDTFRPIDPNNPGNRYGKAPDAGSAFLYFSSTSQQYYISHADYNGFEAAVEAAFESWNAVGPVQFSESTSSGVQVTGVFDTFEGPAWMFQAFNGSTYEINASSIPIVLNTAYTWSNNQQNLAQGILDVQSMVVHEAGHVHGLAHPLTDSYTHDATAPVMAGGDNAFFWTSLVGRHLKEDDIMGVQFLQFRTPGLYSTLPAALSAADSWNARVPLITSLSSSANITVPTNASLKIYPGVTLTFSPGTGLIANGELHINGRGNDRVQLSGSGWTGVHLHGSGSSIFRANIEGAENGISVFNTSDISLGYIDVSDHSGAGIHLINSSGVFINHVRSVDNNQYGILVDGNNNYHWSDNSLRDNGEGLRTIGGARLDNITRTRLADNWNGMVIRDASWIYIASSSFVNNSGRHVVSIENSIANARYNWWEQAPPDPIKFQEATGGTIDYSNWNTVDPIPGVQFIPGDEVFSESSVIQMAESDLPDVIGTVADLRRVVAAYDKDISGQLQYLSQQNWQIEPHITPWKDILRMELLQIEGAYKETESIGLSLLEDISLDQNLRKTAARRLFYSYLLGMKDFSKAAQTLTLLKELETSEFLEDGEDILAGLLEFYGGVTVSELTELQAANESDEIILSNYPNPFNPSTIIRYKLPESGLVSLKVFDLLGRQVAELVNEVQHAGLHSVSFNAEHLSSGLYMYRLQAGDLMITRQMSLVK